MKRHPRVRQRGEVVLASFSGGLAALRYVGELTADEERDWKEGMRVALEIPAQTPPPRQEGPLPNRTWTSRYPRPNFTRWIPGPDTEYALYGGLLRIEGVEVYDVLVKVGWRAAPAPDVASVFVYHSMPRMRKRGALEADAAAASRDPAVKHAQEIERNGGWPTEETRKQIEGHLALMLNSHLVLADDVGTEYQGLGGGTSTGSTQITGTSDFRPAPPSSASLLTVTWLDLKIDVPIA
jgi:hypothetical protein